MPLTGWRSYVFSVGEHFFPAYSKLLYSVKGGEKAATCQATQHGISGLWAATAGAAIMELPLEFLL